MSSEPTETSVLKCIRTDKPIISTPFHDLSFSSVRDLSAYTVLCRTETNEIKIELMWPEEETELLHDLSFLSVKDSKGLFRNIQSELSLCDWWSKELWRLLNATLPTQDNLPSY